MVQGALVAPELLQLWEGDRYLVPGLFAGRNVHWQASVPGELYLQPALEDNINFRHPQPGEDIVNYQE